VVGRDLAGNDDLFGLAHRCDTLDDVDEVSGLLVAGQRLERPHRVGQGDRSWCLGPGEVDLRMAARLQRHLGEDLVELLAGADAGDGHLDVAARDEPCEPDHPAGQVHHLHGLAHVEHEHLAAFGQGCGLQHQLHRFGDRHEEPGHRRVGDGDRSTGVDLMHEGGNHASP
jgi:hypothetical protein